MSNCRRYHELIEAVLADEISRNDRDDLDKHCTSCPDCADLLDLHQNLLMTADEIPLPERHQLRDMRESVLAETGRYSPRSSGGFLADLRRMWRSHPLPLGLAMTILLIAAAYLGRETRKTEVMDGKFLVHSAQSRSDRQVDLNDYLDTPFSFANVSVRPQERGDLALSFDVSRHVELQVSQDSPLAREVLVQAIMDPSSIGSRLRAMEITPRIQDDHLKSALLVTMQDDLNAAVRLGALTALCRYPYDRQIEDALLGALAQDQDVQMRLTALEVLARQNVGLEVIHDAVGEEDPNGTMALMRPITTRF